MATSAPATPLTPKFRLAAMPTDSVQKTLSATFVSEDMTNQSISLHLPGHHTADAKAVVKAALEAALVALAAA